MVRSGRIQRGQSVHCLKMALAVCELGEAVQMGGLAVSRADL